MLIWEPKRWWGAKVNDPRGALLVTLWSVLPGPVIFYEHGVRCIDVWWLVDTFIPWEQWEGYYWEEETVWLLRKKSDYQWGAQYRRIKTPAAKRKKVEALLA